MKKCPVCNMPLPEDSDFCQYCGAKIVNATYNDNRKKPLTADQVLFTNYQVNDQSNDTETTSLKTHGFDSRSDDNKNYLIKQKQRINLLIRIGLIVLILTLVGLNVFQYLGVQQSKVQISSLEQEITTGKTENDTLNKSIIILENEKQSLENYIAELESRPSSEDKVQEIASLKKEILALKNTIKTKDSTIDSLNSQITTLKKDRTELQTKNNNLVAANEKAAKAISAYNAMKAYSYGTLNVDYFTNENIVVVKVGQSKSFDIWSSLNTTLYVNGSNDNIEIKWGTWDYNKCPITVTGKTEGTTTLSFTNEANKIQFKVLVVIIPR